MMKLNSIKAFTLSEILLALIIVGIIAALTIPPLLQKSTLEERRSALKKAISSLNNALKVHYSLTGLTAHDYQSSSDIVDELFLKRMHIGERDTDFTSEICDGRVFSTTDGMLYCINNFVSDSSDAKNSICNNSGTISCSRNNGANIWIDVNGLRKPNAETTTSERPKDIYLAQLFSNRVLPYGRLTQEVMYGTELNLNNDADDGGDSSDTGNQGGESGGNPGGEQGGNQGGNGDINDDLGDDEDLRPWIDDYFDRDRWGDRIKDFLNWLRDLLKAIGILH